MIAKITGMLYRFTKRWSQRALIALIAVTVTFFGMRIYESQRGLRLELWHTFVPQDMTANQIDMTDWLGYLAAENKLFNEVKENVTDRLIGTEQSPFNRYSSDSIIYPDRFKQNWNRSYIMLPDSKPRGAVVLLHGLTDTPYSLRHIANLYREHGFVAIGIRLPAHGTVPSALSNVHWQDWLAATRLAVREAKRLTGRDMPLHIIGFSNGGALAMKYTLDALDDPTLAKPQQVVLISPMIGVTSFARFAGLAGLPAVFPPFAKSAWLSVLPEFNPFKYNSFPVNGGRQSHLLTTALQQQIYSKATDQKLDALPPILTFQSVVDFTVSTRAIITALYNLLPSNGSELVLFDVNRSTNVELLLRSSALSAINQLLPKPPRKYQATLITNATARDPNMVARSTDANQSTETVKPIGLQYPPEMFSLSHLAIPFPVSDSLYGSHPENPTEFGISLGNIAVRGERLVLVVDLDTLLRASSNPFYPYIVERIDADIPREKPAP